MWIIFSILCMILMMATDIIGKKAVGKDESAPIKQRILVIVVSTALGLLMYAIGVGESGLAPWAILLEHPAVFAATFCIVLSDFLYMLSLKYVGMTIMETISSMEGVVIFACLVAINLFSGRLNAIKEMFSPLRLVILLVILTFTFVLPNIEAWKQAKGKKIGETADNRKKLAAGILIAFSAVLLGCGDSLILDILFDAGSLGATDMAMATYFAQIFLLPLFCIALIKKRGKAKTSVKLFNRYSVSYAIVYVIYMFFGILATSIDPVRAEVMYLTYPVISILGARVILKEKYTLRQNICIWVITLAAICFCVIDYVV